MDIRTNLSAEFWLKTSCHYPNIKFSKLKKIRLASHRFITGTLILDPAEWSSAGFSMWDSHVEKTNFLFLINGTG